MTQNQLNLAMLKVKRKMTMNQQFWSAQMLQREVSTFQTCRMCFTTRAHLMLRFMFIEVVEQLELVGRENH